MSPGARTLAAASFVAAGSLVVASLAIVRVVPAWGVVFFYVIPSFFFAAWGTRELAPEYWRRTAAPVRRAWRLSRLGRAAELATVPPAPPRPARPPSPESTASPADVLAVGARIWLQLMRACLELLRARRARLVFNLVFGAAALATFGFAIREVVRVGWPLGSAQPAGTAAAVAFFLSTFGLRALAWQRLFRPFERPASVALAASFGAASVTALALPSRVDDAVSIAVVRRLGRRAPSIGTIALSLFLLGLMDMAALTPFAAFAAIGVDASAPVRLTMALLAGVGVGAAALAAALPSIRKSARLTRWRLGHWLAVHAPGSRRDTLWSWFLVAGSWLTRAAGLFLLLRALDLRAPFAVATSYVVAGAGAAALPVGPAGAATQAGVGAAVLAGAGIPTSQAIALAVAAQVLTVAAGAALAGFGLAAQLSGRRRRR